MSNLKFDPEFLVTQPFPRNYLVHDDGRQVLNDLGSALKVGSGIVGGLLGSSSSKNGGTQTTTSVPWAEQQPYLKTGFEGAQTALGNAQGMGSYQGPYTAGLNPYQQQGYDSTAGFAQNQGMGGANALYNAGMGALGANSQFLGNAGSMFAQAGQDPTQQIIGNAGQYASNPYMNSMIDAASRDVTRNLYENQLTGLDMAAAGTGNMNSSRTGIAQGIMERGAADRIGDISAQLRGNAYNNGLGMAQTQYNNNLSQQLNANGQLLQGANFGANALSNGINAGYNAGDALTKAGAGLQTQAQNEINGQRQQFTAQQNGQLDLLAKYMGIVNGNMGQTSTSTSTANGATSALSGALGGMGLYNSLAGSSSPTYSPGSLGSGTYGLLSSNMGTATTPLGGSPLLANAYGLGSGLSNVGASGVKGSGW